MGNHDQNRVAYRLGEDRVDMINMLLLTLPGASVTYNVIFSNAISPVNKMTLSIFSYRAKRLE